MNTLPKDTFLGRLSFFEIYDDFFGPKCFSVRDDLQQLYLVYWSGDYDEGTVTKWLYMPVSQRILDELLREEYSFHEAFSNSKRLLVVSTYASERNQKTIVETLSGDDLHSVNLPPTNFSIDPLDIQSIAPESRWDFNLRIAKRSGKGSPADNAITKVLDAFGEIIRLLMKDERNKQPAIYPLTAGYSSFDVKLGTSNQERAAVAIELLESILSDKNNIEERLDELGMDPYRLKDLLDIVNLEKLELTLKSKTSDTLRKPIKIGSGNLLPIIKKLEESTNIVIDSLKVPQANCLDRVVDIVKHRVNGGELRHELIDGITSDRQVSYHTHAARCLGLLNRNNTITSAGRVLAQKSSKVAQYQFLADRVESSDFGWAWMKWAGVADITDLDPDSAEPFIRECVKGLRRTSINRRASSLSSWIAILKKHRREYGEDKV
ncbi:DUF6575 domain-containing protein [Shewanella sp. SM29]|uniref:DUF6575 domain-containing protein n=1 Tax=Shewanella sp. SM29 TaxID=2912795 RepID=UPI0021D9FB3E|nr:DUF6575 domain-containing protein [Shewanella sp. SM29]MCU8073830.1 hypothetical protein [Shewanella sp. SM29]